MKIRTIVTLGIGYALGVKLGPDQIEAILRGALVAEKAEQGVTPTVVATDAEWPDTTFTV